MLQVVYIRFRFCLQCNLIPRENPLLILKVQRGAAQNSLLIFESHIMMTGFASLLQVSVPYGTCFRLHNCFLRLCEINVANQQTNLLLHYYSYFLQRRVACKLFFSAISLVKSQRIAIMVWVSEPRGRLTSCYSGATPFLVYRAPLRPVLQRSIIVIFIIIIIITTTIGISTATRVENCADTAINP